MNYLYVFFLLLIGATMALAQPSTEPRCSYLTFNGSTDGVQFTSRTDLLPASGGAISFWMKPNSYADRANVLTTAGIDPDVNPNNGFRFEFEPDGRLSVVIGGPASTSALYLRRLTSPFLFSTNWQHIALVYKTSQNSFWLYHNGLLVESGGALSIPNGPQNPYFGAGLNENRRYNGALEDVVFWNRALTQADVMSLQSTTLTGTEPGMMSWYGFNRDGAGGGIDVADEVDPTLVAGVRYDGTTQGNSAGTTPAFVSSPCSPLPPTIATAPLGGTALCEGGFFQVVFSATGQFSPGNQFRVQLSNSTGNFDNPTTLSGSITSTSAVTIPVNLPLPLPDGSGYRFRVVSTNPVVVGTDNGTDITVWQRPSITGQPVSGSVVCVGASITVSTTVVGTVSSYQWGRPMVVPGQTSPTLSLTNVQLSDAGEYKLYVGGQCQSGISAPFNLTVLALPESATVTGSTNFTAREGNTVSLTATCRAGNVPVVRQSATQVGNSTALVVNSPATTGTYNYSVTCRNLANCESSTATLATATILPPCPMPIIITSGPSDCVGGVISMSAIGPFSYQWLTPSGLVPITPTIDPIFSASLALAGVYTVTLVATSMNGCSHTGFVSVTAHPTPTVYLLPPSTTMCAGETVELIPVATLPNARVASDLTTSGGGFASYRWNTGATTPTLSVSAGGTYSVTVTNTQGCSATNSATVTVSVAHALTLTANRLDRCSGEPISLTATGCSSGTVNWSNGQTGAVIMVPSAVTAIWAQCRLGDCAGPNSQTITFSLAPSLILSASSFTICEGRSSVLSATNCTGGVVRWSTGQTGRSLTVRPTQTTIYSATCTLGSCVLTPAEALTVTVRPLPSAPTLTLTASSICAGQSAPLASAQCAGASSVLYRNTTIPGQVSVWGICRGECDSPTSNTVTYQVVTPPATPTIVSSQTAVCPGNSLTLNALGCNNPAETVVWSTGETGLVLIISLTATTTFRATCQARGCNSATSAGYRVVLLARPTFSIRTTTGSSTICAGGAAVLQAVGCPTGNQVVWSTGDITQSLTVSPGQSTTYRATCLSVCPVESVPLLLTVREPVSAPVVTTSTTSVCGTGVVSLSAQGCAGGTVRWSTNQTGLMVQVLISLGTGTRSFWASCIQSGCTSPLSNTVSVVQYPSPPVPTVTASQTALCAGNSVTLTATGCDSPGQTVNWSTGASGPFAVTTPAATTTYRATCAQNGCVSGNSASVSVRVNPIPVVTVTGLSSVCAGTSVTLRASGCSSGTVIWSTGVTGPNLLVSPAQSTTYTARCVSSFGCTSESSGFGITVSTPATPQITASSTALCVGGGIVSLSATGCPDGTLLWSNAQVGPDQSIQLTQSTSFYATCRLPNGCTSPRSNTITVIVSSLRVSPGQLTVNPNSPFSLTVSGCIGGTIHWGQQYPFSNVVQSFTTAGSITAYPVSFTSASSTTPYSITARCADGRCADLIRTVQIRSSASVRLATEQVADVELVAAPVPFTDELTVWLPTDKAPASVALLDIVGRAHLTRSVPAGESAVRLNTGSLIPGMYLLELWQNERRYTRKVLKQ